MTYWQAFLTGLLSGGLTCAAMQGGLLASVIANQKKQFAKQYAMTSDTLAPIAMFLTTKLFAHAALGFLLGSLGAVVSLSIGVRLGFQLLAAAFMFATAMNLLEVHPIFRHLSFQTPRFLRRLIRSQSKSDALFAPALLGLLTIFIPCGVTQAVEVTVIAAGQPVAGALVMAAFVLGTSPIFALVGLATSKLSDLWQKRFALITATVLVLMAGYSVNGILTVLDSPFTIQKFADGIEMAVTPPSIYANRHKSMLKPMDSEEQRVAITVTSQGYSPTYIQVKNGVPVTLSLDTNDVYSCASEFVLKKFGISARLKPTDHQEFRFTPTERGKFSFSCAMGMYTGTLEVM